MGARLTDNAIGRILNGEEIPEPVLQVARAKQMKNDSRWKLDLSDGVNMISAMMLSQLNEMMEDGRITEGSLIKLDKYMAKDLKGRNILVVLACEAVGKAPIIGNPVAAGMGQSPVTKQEPEIPAPRQIPPTGAPQTLRAQQSGPTRQYGQVPHGQNGAAPMQLSSPSPAQQQHGAAGVQAAQFAGRGPVVQQRGGMQSAADDSHTMPIRGVHPYQNKWTIRARVTSKSDIRTWNKGENNQGKLFSVTLTDAEEGEIRATFFRDGVDKFFDLIQENRVYLFSGGRAKLANRDFSRVNNDYELTFDANSAVVPVADDTTIKAVTMKRTKINDISQVAPNSMVDVLGVAIEIGDVQEFTAKSGRELIKLEVNLVDESGASIRVTLWGDRAKDFKAKASEVHNPVVGFKNCRVSDWGGRTLGTVGGSQILLEPDLAETPVVRAWFEAGGAAGGATALSGSGGASSGAPNKGVAERHTISSIKQLQLGKGDKADFVDVKATITRILTEKMWYYACPTEGNNRKVTEAADGSWLCAATEETFPTKENRYIMRASLADFSGCEYATFFHDQALKVLGRSADEMEILKNENAAEFERVVEEATFSTFLCRLRLKEEAYNGETRVKATVSSFSPVDWVAESKELIKAIQAYN